MGFKEQLPDACPPREAHEGACEIAFRLVPSKTPCLDDFASKAAKAEPLLPGACPCRWASCSLYVDLGTIEKKRKTFKKLREYPFAAQMRIKAGSGRLLQEKAHIDFWMYDDFDPIESIVEIKGL